jgi:DnaK suppressor protein
VFQANNIGTRTNQVSLTAWRIDAITCKVTVSFWTCDQRTGGILANGALDQEFVDGQKQRLIDLRDELARVRDGLEEDERGLEGGVDEFTETDSGDQSQSIFDREMDATLEEQTERRLQDVERALEKIEEGTYGVCDDTGENIPRGRLEAVPEAVRTVEAQQRFERERRLPS